MMTCRCGHHYPVVRNGAQVIQHAATKGNQGGWGGGSSGIDTAVDECRNEVADRVARYQLD